MCQDGGEIWLCDEQGCHRAVCSKCIEIPANELSKLSGPSVKFACPSCHWKLCRNTSSPYFASAFFVSFHVYTNIFDFLQGFTRNGVPILRNFLTVKGGFETSTSATVQAPPIILLHLRIHSIQHISHFNAMHQLLSEYYHDDTGNQLLVMDLAFNISDERAVAKWSDKAAAQVAGVSGYSHIIVFVTTHSDPDRGDLWLGHDKHNEPCATTISNVSTGLFYYFIPILTINSIVV